MINLIFEHDLHLSSQDRYDIISFAMEAADDNGFINSFVYERALYCYAAIMLYPERREEIGDLLSDSPIVAWEQLIEDGTIATMKEEYNEELNVLSDEGAVWYDEYADWAHSARGILDMVQNFTGDIVQAAARKLQGAAQQSGVSELLDIADDWGMNRKIAEPSIEVKYSKPVSNSLFSD